MLFFFCSRNKLFNNLLNFIGSSIIFTGILAILILKNKLQCFRWTGMILVTVGLVVIGVCDMIWANDAEHSSTDIVVGNF